MYYLQTLKEDHLGLRQTRYSLALPVASLWRCTRRNELPKLAREDLQPPNNYNDQSKVLLQRRN